MTILILLVLCAVVPSALTQRNLQRMKPIQRSTYEFAVELTTRVAQEKNNHFIVSTFSIWALLATASLGSTGQTLDEFRNVLRLNRLRYFNNRYLELVQSTTGGNVTLERSSSIFAANRLRIKDEFLRRARDIGFGEVVVMPFDDPQATATTIDQHVSRATHGKITDLLSPEDLVGIDLVLIDALYFKGLWKKEFPSETTEWKPFYDDTGAQIGEVEMMGVKGSFKLSRVSLPGATVLELPFGEDGRFAMLVFLPDPTTTLSAVINSLSHVSLTTIYASFNHDDVDRVYVELPRFEMSSELDNLRELLGDMGLRAAFASGAQFSLMSDEPLSISNVVQKATLSVSEQGAEASAATVGQFFLISRSPSFSADKPFLYMIVDTVARVPLFTGAYSQPSKLKQNLIQT